MTVVLTLKFLAFIGTTAGFGFTMFHGDANLRALIWNVVVVLLWACMLLT